VRGLQENILAIFASAQGASWKIWDFLVGILWKNEQSDASAFFTIRFRTSFAMTRTWTNSFARGRTTRASENNHERWRCEREIEQTLGVGEDLGRTFENAPEQHIHEQVQAPWHVFEERVHIQILHPLLTKSWPFPGFSRPPSVPKPNVSEKVPTPSTNG